MDKKSPLKEKILQIVQMDEKIDFYIHKKLLRKIERAEREYSRERSEIIRFGIKKFSKLVGQEQKRTLSANKVSLLLSEGEKDSKDKISFRCTTPMKDFIDASGNRAEFLNKVVAWYIKLDEQARPFRKKVSPPVIAAVEGIDYVVEKQEDDF